MVPLLGYIAYLLIKLSTDSAGANFRAKRILHRLAKLLVANELPPESIPIVITWLSRCGGHMGHIVLRNLIMM